MDLFLFSGFNRFMHFLSIYAYSWINLQARRTQFDSAWYRVGLGGRCKPGMALITIGEAVPQWGRVADWSSCRTVEAITAGAVCGFIRRRSQMQERSRSPAAWWMPSQPRLIGDETEIQQNGFGRPKRVDGSVEEDRAALPRPGVSSGPLQSHESYSGGGWRRSGSPAEGRVKLSEPSRLSQAATGIPATGVGNKLPK
jgi:hypothetical protein